MSTIVRGNFAKDLWPGVNRYYGLTYKEHAPQWTQLFEIQSSSKAYEEDVSLSGFGALVQKTEGGSVSYDDARQGFVTRYTHVTYGLGFKISKEAVEDDQAGIQSKLKATALARSIRSTKEILGHAVFNGGFDTTTTSDGAYLFSSSHLLVRGGTFRNQLATAANLSELALEQAVIDLGAYVDDRGHKIAVRPVSLHVPTALEFDAYRILNSIGRSDTANNDPNALRQMGKFPGGVKVHNYLTDANAWIIKTDCPEGGKYFNRRGDSFEMDNDVDTQNAKFIATFRGSWGVTDPRQYFASAGA